MTWPQGDRMLEMLKKPNVDHVELQRRQQEVNERMAAQQERTQARHAELVGRNSTLPVTVSSVRVLHAKHTRHGFLERVFHPLLTASNAASYTLEKALRDIGRAVKKLEQFDIFKSPISVYVERADKSSPSTCPTDLEVYVHARERSRYTIKTGTEAGSAEGSAYASAQLRNLFGGAESINAHASAGTRTRSAYLVFFDTPLLSNPDLRWGIGGLASSKLKSWASHEEVRKGGSTGFKWQSAGGHQHELAYSGFWRQMTSLGEAASPTVRADAGDTFKSSISHTYTLDRRDFPLLPTRGYFVKTVAELAGGPLKGDVGFGRFKLESQAALAFPRIAGAAFTVSFRTGLLHPFVDGNGNPTPSRINDRFQLGGPTDVRGFRLGGLGPRDGVDAVGGDLFAAGSANLVLPLPRVGSDTPLRLQAFVNAGRLLALKEANSDKGHGSAQSSLKATFSELVDGLPSAAAGVGLVYAHPAARFEVNFSLPLILRRGEQGRKGAHFGVGIDFM